MRLSIEQQATILQQWQNNWGHGREHDSLVLVLILDIELTLATRLYRALDERKVDVVLLASNIERQPIHEIRIQETMKFVEAINATQHFIPALAYAAKAMRQEVAARLEQVV